MFFGFTAIISSIKVSVRRSYISRKPINLIFLVVLITPLEGLK